MGAEIDRLEVQVEAQATKANNQLDKMVVKLDRVASSLMNINHGGLTGLANGVSKFAQASGQLSNVRTADFTRLAKNIQSISSINTQQIYSAASAMTMISKAMNNLGSVSANSMQVAQVAKDISKLGGANVQRAVTNLPQLATALSTFMTVMSKAPAVSDNIIRMTNALASLASQGGKVGTATKTVSNALNAQNNSITRNAKNVNGLASALGKLYQKYFWIRRVASKVWDSTESSMDFLETVNYFEVAMRDIGDSAAAQWSENGYSSAETYAESFSERAKQLTEKMTGYSIDKDGNATYLGAKNLGMDPEKVMQYQATYAQISSSIGVAEESALNFSKVLTMLGADWASLRNLTFDQAWEKFASALAGQSRAIRSLGIDITNATLQEYAYKYGLEIAVSEMNQATKAQLRLLAILDQSDVAFGDLANTIQSPANQIRMLQQNVSNLGRVFGNLFLPVLQKTLPFINGVVIALQNLFSWIGNLLGIKFESINSSMGGMSEEMSDLVGGAEDFEDGLNGANNAAKKLNKTLQSWHEINNITTQDNSGSSGANIGGGSAILDDEIANALADYEKVWNEAFDRMENKAQKYAEKIGKFLEPVKQIIEDFAIGDFFKAGQDTSSLVAGIFNFFADAIDNVDWEKLGQNIGEFIEGIDWIKVISSAFKLRFNIWKAIAEVWFGSFDAAPIETTIITAIGLLKFTRLGDILAPKIVKAIMSTKLMSEITTAWVSLGGLGGILTADLATVMGAGTLTEIGMTIGVGIIGGIATAFAGFNVGKELGKWFNPEDAEWYDNFTWFGENGFFETVTDDFEISWNALNDMISDTSTPFNAFASTITSMVFPLNGLIGKIQNLGDSFGSVSDKAYDLGSSLSIFYSESINNITDFIGKTLLKIEELKEKASQKFEEFKTIVGEKMSAWYSKVSSLFDENKWNFSGIKDGLSTAFNSAISYIKQIWSTFATWLNDKLNWKIEPISIAGKQIFDGATINLGKIPTFSTGGLPEDGLFMANHSELVGKFANGKTAVANNEQITAGIEEAAYRGMTRALMENGGNITIHVEGDSSGMYRVWKEEYRSEAERLQNNPVPIF